MSAEPETLIHQHSQQLKCPVTVDFHQLNRTIPPPHRLSTSIHLEEFRWVESELGLSLPDDYKELVCAYGTSYWLDFLVVFNPYSTNKWTNLLLQTPLSLGAERIIRDHWADEVPFALYPEPGGLLPWGGTDNGNSLFWLTEGDPNSWPTFIGEARGPTYEYHPLTCCGIILNWVMGNLEIDVFPDSFEYGAEGAVSLTE